MIEQGKIGIWIAALVSLVFLAGCDTIDGAERAKPSAPPVDGTFVGRVAGSDSLVAVVASPPPKGTDRREVTVYVSDGKSLSASLSGMSVRRNSFVADSDDGEAQAKGDMTADSAKGTIRLPNGRTGSYQAGRATGAAGLYELTISSKGRLEGASAAGVGLTSRTALEAPGTATVKFADGRSRKFELTTRSATKPVRLRGGQVRLIVLPDGDMRGAGQRRASAGADNADFFIHSASKAKRP